MHTSDEQRIKDNQKEARANGSKARETFEQFVNTEGGKLWVANIAKDCRVMDTVFTGNSTTFFQDGQRSVALGILKEVADVSPAAYAEIMKDILK